MNKVVAVVLIFLIVISLLGIGVSVLFYTQRETVDDVIKSYASST